MYQIIFLKLNLFLFYYIKLLRFYEIIVLVYILILLHILLVTVTGTIYSIIVILLIVKLNLILYLKTSEQKYPVSRDRAEFDKEAGSRNQIAGTIKIIKAQVRTKGLRTAAYFSISTRDIHGHYHYNIVKASTLKNTAVGRRAIDRYAAHHRLPTDYNDQGDEVDSDSSVQSISEDTIQSEDNSGADSPQPIQRTNTTQQDHKHNY